MAAGREHAQNIVDRLDILEKERLEKLEKKQRMKLPSEELQEETFAPKLNPNTLKIVEKMKQQKRDRGGMPVEEYLEKKEKDRQRALLKKTEEHFNNLAPGQPRITQRAAEIIREGSVSDRLYEESFKLNEKKLEIQQQKQLQEQYMYEFQPRINTLDIDRGDSLVFDHLLEREQQLKAKKRENMEKLLEKERQLHHPKINPVSEEIASRLPNSSQERLLQATKPLKRDYSPSWTFRPKINQKSKQIELEKTGNVDFQSRIDRLYNHEKKKKEKILQLKSEYEQRELEECTFSPRMNQAEVRVASFEERTSNWEKKRRAKMAREREVVEKKSMEECTFRPITNAEKRLYESALRAGHSSDSLLNGSLDDPIGFEEFVQRQREARAMKEQSVKGVFTTGEKWRNEITVPKEFNLGMKRSTSIKSLRKPLSPSRNVSRGLIEDSDDDSGREGATSIQDADKTKEKTISNEDSLDVPPQGLFSSMSSFKILEGLNHLYQSPTKSSNKDSRNQTANTFLIMETTSSEEWAKRNFLKNDASKMDSPRTRTPGRGLRIQTGLN